MERLTIKELAPYLPYKLKVKDEEYNEIFEVCSYNPSTDEWLVYDNIDGSVIEYCLEILKPLLRPLSSLTEEIEHNGERFVPMVRLLEMTEMNQLSKDEMLKNCSSLITVNVISCETKNYNSINMVCHEVKYLVETSNMGALVYSFSYDEHFDRFSKIDLTRNISLGVGHQKQLFEKLYEWHFDTGNLLCRALAIPIDGKEVEGE